MNVGRFAHVFCILFLIPFALVFGGNDDDSVGPLPQPTTLSDCPGRPLDAKPVDFKVLLVQRVASPRPPAAEPALEGDATPSVNLGGRQQIRSEEEYQSVFGEPPSGIDWSLSRIVVVPLVTTYKLDRLDSTVTFAGMSQTADAIYVGLTFTQVGPCQGIAQKGEWFTRDQLNYLVLVPTNPDRIVFYTCVVNGCPPNIP